jgi:hypothetical protein
MATVIPVKLTLLPVSFGGFGVMFVVFGAQRLWRAARERSFVEAVIWGSIGIMFGLGAVYVAAWMVWKFAAQH